MLTLDPQQQAAVMTSSRRALIEASPGSGKTHCIIERAAYLMEERSVSPYEILLVTFTRKAAQEMRQRLVARIGSKGHHCTIGTFHAIALDHLQRFGGAIGYKTGNTVYGEWEEQFLLRDVAQEMGILRGKTWKIPKKDVQGVFDHYYQTGEEPELYDPCYDLFRAFIQRCRENNSYTYGSLLTGFKMLLPHIAQYLQWKHVIQDESQDADRLQWSIVEELVKWCGASLYCVSDLDQTLYHWRGACPEYILENQDSFNIYKLETNYRSVPEIVMAANSLISHNRDRITKTMVPAREDGGEIGYLKDMDSDAVVKILTQLDGPHTVLARNHFLLEKISRLLCEQEIPHVYVGQCSALINSEEFRRFHAFLKLLVNPFDNFSFLLIKDLVGISQEEYAVIRVKAAEAGLSHFMAWSKCYDFVDELLGDGDDLWEVADRIARRLEGNNFYFGPASAFIRQYEGKRTITDYLNWLALYEVTDDIREKDCGITLMTVHAAKGLEWPTVIVAGCNEGILPSKHAADNDEVEAERRLFYVAMTRARDQLVLTIRPEVIEKDGRVYEIPKSRFVGEAFS